MHKFDDCIRCPACGFLSNDLNEFNCRGACGHNVFCTKCAIEFDPVTGKRTLLCGLPECGGCRDLRAIDIWALVQETRKKLILEDEHVIGERHESHN